MWTFSRLMVLCAITACALGHAVLVTPLPYNTNPSKTGPCGVTPGALPTMSSQAAWFAGSTINIMWQLIASDGSGTVTAMVDPAGGTSFTQSLDFTFTTTSLGQYPESFVMPNGIDCSASPDGLCTVQFSTSSGWFSCTRINITSCPGCPTPPPNPPTPTQTENLIFCTDRNKQTVLIPEGQSPNAIDLQAEAAYLSYLNNTNVFQTPNAPGCRADYKLFLCNLELPLNPGAGQTITTKTGCHADCVKAMTECTLNPIHSALYNCSSLPLCIGESSASSLAASLALFIVAAMVLLF